MESVETLATILAITRARKPGLSQPDRVQTLLDSADPERVLEQLTSPALLDDPLLEQARQDVDRWTGQGMKMVSVLSDQYPRRLRDVREAPALLWFQGDLQADDQGVCVVGSRQADAAALDVASYVSAALVDQGLTVVAGLAAGIDAAAHRAALQAGGRTVAVMGTGLDRTYPRDHAGLRDSIVEASGLVVTQFEPGATISRSNFPMRNAVMSGYGITTFVVAASEHSGTRSQARYAVRHGRGVILARRVAEGTQWGQMLVRGGQAQVADSTADVLEHVRALQAERDQAERLLRDLVA
ncbi:DNA protecting protein DprA [Actinomyces sp. 594]|uniref:DNA-processing protein DprA n=1 Tax=Actinomyces sp. 594 TaxID=2057793 RepID=UPI001C559BD2|nr:DNA-processing protein DprA [Actinomyces sp. 594]MBW3068971.1 DNA protecting protein DprA [Actinomyces sp. 594]